MNPEYSELDISQWVVTFCRSPGIPLVLILQNTFYVPQIVWTISLGGGGVW